MNRPKQSTTTISKDSSEEMPDLHCLQEEADKCLLLHATHVVSEGYKAVVISSEDTDVFILCLVFSDNIAVLLSQK